MIEPLPKILSPRSLTPIAHKAAREVNSSVVFVIEECLALESVFDLLVFIVLASRKRAMPKSEICYMKNQKIFLIFVLERIFVLK